MQQSWCKLNKAKRVATLAVFTCLLPLAGAPVKAASFISVMIPSITIQAECEITRVRRMNFNRHGLLNANIDKRRNMRVMCTSGTPYEIGLDAGSTAGGTTITRKMLRGVETIDYQLFQDSARTVNWGNTPGVDTKSGVGNGRNQGHRIYGRVPVQTTPSPGRYLDTVTVTVFF